METAKFTKITKDFILDFYKKLTEERDIQNLRETLNHISSPEYRGWWIEQSRENAPNIERLISFNSEMAAEYATIAEEIAGWPDAPEGLYRAAVARRAGYEKQVDYLKGNLEELRGLGPVEEYENIVRGYQAELEAALRIGENKERYEELKEEFKK